jgi:hypothetical protein
VQARGECRERWSGGGVLEGLSGGVLGPPEGDREQSAAVDDLLGVVDRAGGGAVVDDGADVVPARGDFDEDVRPGGQAKRADPTAPDVGAMLEPGDRCVSVAPQVQPYASGAPWLWPRLRAS